MSGGALTRWLVRSIGVALLAAGSGGAVAAQTPTGFSPLSVFQLADRQDWLLRASTSDGATVAGRVRDIDDASARLEGGRVAFADLVLLERGERENGGAWTGAVIGGAVLGGLTAVGLFFAPIGDADADELLFVVSAAVGIGAVTGGLIGAALDPAETVWRPIWPSGSTGMRE